MKKILLAVALFVAMCGVSACNSGSANSDSATTDSIEAVDSCNTVVDTVEVDSIVAEADTADCDCDR